MTTQNDAKFLSKLLDLVCYRLHTCNAVAPAIVTDFINEDMCAKLVSELEMSCEVWRCILKPDLQIALSRACHS